ncbi:hypothetical protein PTTG_01132 [Puccinia triticina 1-1 BBBD Race 1]|uniref:Mitochondrial carrier n=2 Tax=Puccinia triticina TaxID=208348 RepID=A0A0C4EK59_PUCT1|nr:uncharacterized protein PtA15_10A567 [Puccinia triticina]OAV97684.1 hypothetical protein PTTG_01132 [Puccinia triticina 1-1 BBBD Race 1]WAQ89143.1 hypothetical protein PtA15_10A567 [Puccinia triticina]WAR59198.1 hypothetical protein PtB15_10B540 [Puccinia triticina]
MSHPEPQKRSKGKHPQLQQHPDLADDTSFKRLGSGAGLQSATTVRPRDKILAACAGGCLTSLTMTPLDVVKTRLQTQSQPFPGIAYYHSTTTTTALNHIIHDHPLSQAYPSRPSPPSNGTLATLLQIVRFEGIGSLWRGIAPTLMITIPAQAIYMLGYDMLRSAFLELVPPTGREGLSSASSFAAVIPLLSGAMSRSLVVALFSPLELIRTRLQSTPVARPQLLRLAPFDPNGRGGVASPRPILGTLLSSVRSTGLRTLYTGLPATLWRDVPFSALYWSSYEASRRILSGGLGFGEADSRASVHQLALQSFFAGSLSGAVAATLTNPFDVVKTRRQASPYSPSSSSHTPRPPGTIRIILQIARSEGIRNGLMRGLSPRLAKVIPGCGIMIASYEGLAQVLSKY